MPLDYSKWDNIEVSDDEDDTHPNVDTPSLFRWRHKARVERETALKEKRIEVDKEGDKLKARLAKQNISEEEKRKQLEHWKKKEREIAEEERKAPHSVDTLSKDASSITHINKPTKYEDFEAMTMEEKEASYKKFLEENKDKVKQFGFMRDPVESERFLSQNRQLICEHTSNFLVVWCIDLEMEEKNELMKSVASQTISMQFILELAKGIKRHPSECYSLFYRRFIEAKNKKNSGDTSSKEVEYFVAFETELAAFIDRVEKRAKVKMQEMIEQYEQEEKEERIKASPCGLDPQEVMESLPDDLADCFIKRDTQMLQDVLATKGKEYMPYIENCVRSGLWVPGQDSPLYKLIDPNHKLPGEVGEEGQGEMEEIDEDDLKNLEDEEDLVEEDDEDENMETATENLKTDTSNLSKNASTVSDASQSIRQKVEDMQLDDRPKVDALEKALDEVD